MAKKQKEEEDGTIEEERTTRETKTKVRKARKVKEEVVPKKATASGRQMTVGGVSSPRPIKRDWEANAPWNQKTRETRESRFERARTAKR